MDGIDHIILTPSISRMLPARAFWICVCLTTLSGIAGIVHKVGFTTIIQQIHAFPRASKEV